MGRIVSYFFIAFDGVVEAPDKWHFSYFDDAMARVVEAGMAQQQAFLMGRRLYEEWSQYWPAQGDDVPFSSYINGSVKYVVTHRPLDREPWHNTTVVSGTEDEVVDQLREVKQRTDGDIGMSGCATTARWLLAQGLLDELSLLVHPIAVGSGQRLFEGTGTVPLTLLGCDQLPSGVLHLRYSPLQEAARTGR